MTWDSPVDVAVLLLTASDMVSCDTAAESAAPLPTPAETPLPAPSVGTGNIDIVPSSTVVGRTLILLAPPAMVVGASGTSKLFCSPLGDVVGSSWAVLASSLSSGSSAILLIRPPSLFVDSCCPSAPSSPNERLCPASRCVSLSSPLARRMKEISEAEDRGITPPSAAGARSSEYRSAIRVAIFIDCYLLYTLTR